MSSSSRSSSSTRNGTTNKSNNNITTTINQQKQQVTNTAVLTYAAPQRREELLELLGGKQVLHAAVDRFYEGLLSDKRLLPFFEGSNIQVLKWHQFNFMSVAFSAVPVGLNVPNMVLEKHKRLFDMGLNETHFDIMMEHLRSTFAELEIDPHLVEEAVQVLKPLRDIFQQGAQMAAAREHREDVWRRVHLVVAVVAVVGFGVYRHWKRSSSR